MPQGSRAARTAPLIAADSPCALFVDLFESGSPGAPSARRWTFSLTPPRLPDAGQVTCVGGVGRGSSGSGTAATGADVEAPVDVEELTEIIAITADFADRTVRDRIGCV